MVVKFFTNITLQLMKNFLHFDLMQKVKNCLTNDNPLEGRYETQQTAFLTSFRRLDEAMLISRKSLLTPEIQKLDSQRVAEWRIIKTAAKESLKMSPAEKGLKPNSRCI